MLRRQALLLIASAAGRLAHPLGPPQPAPSGNPILPGWYADPEAHVFGDRYWIYPTSSAPYDQQTFVPVTITTTGVQRDAIR